MTKNISEKRITFHDLPNVTFQYYPKPLSTQPAGESTTAKDKINFHAVYWAEFYKRCIYGSYKAKPVSQDIRSFKKQYEDPTASVDSAYNDPIYHYALAAALGVMQEWIDPKEGMHCYIAYENKKPIGFVHFNEQAIDREKIVYIAQMGVAMRGKGIGRRLMQCVLSHYQPHQKFRIATRNFNTEANTLYKNRLGFSSLLDEEVQQLGLDPARYVGFEHVTSDEEVAKILQSTKTISRAREFFDGLENVNATLGFTLFSRAQTERDEELKSKLIPFALKPETSRKAVPARDVLEQLGFSEKDIQRTEVKSLNRKVVALRDAAFSKKVEEFVNTNAGEGKVIVVELWAGLDSRLEMYRNDSRVLGLSMDLKQTRKIRKRLFDEQNVSKKVDASGSNLFVSDRDIRNFDTVIQDIETIAKLHKLNAQKTPVFFTAAGLFPYFSTEEIWKILETIHRKFESYEIAFEEFTPRLIEKIRRNTDVSKTGATVSGTLSPNAVGNIEKKLSGSSAEELIYATYPTYWNEEEKRQWRELCECKNGEEISEHSSRIVHVRKP
ncbi:MAG: GNAT family N-acetyltransferase [Gammaproteobacteria bacterium]|nr:GNAT family N-acetyltransferase [Gammaproteobacteria bacterium]